MRDWLPEAQMLFMMALRWQAQSPTPPASAVTDPTLALPLGLPVSTWVAILGVGGGGAIFGNAIVSIVKTGVGAVQTYGEDLPMRLKADRERDGVETQNLVEEVRFAKIVNDALSDSRLQISDLQTKLLTLLSNDIQRATLITQMQQTMLDQQISHDKAIGEMKEQISIMQLKNDKQDVALQQAQDEAGRWKGLYEAEHERAEHLAQLNDQLSKTLQKYQTSENVPVVNDSEDVSIEAGMIKTEPLMIDEIPKES